jgi:3-keto-5-aminohexanoate cleavage enzyme
MERDAVVIEVGLNEAVTRAAHPSVPQSPAECALDARRCAEAGASILHWHAVDEAGVQRLADVDLYGAALAAMGRCALAYPSYPTDVPDTVDERLAHCLALRALHGMELAPVDVATVNLVLWDDDTRALAPLVPTAGYDVIRNSLPFVADALVRYREAGLVPTLAAFDLGSTRTIATLARAGLIDEPILCKIFLWGSPTIGPAPSVEALDLHLRQLPADLDVEWLVVPYGIADPAQVEQLARAALERGGGLRIGIGDNPIAFAGTDNARLVERASCWAADAGRPLASPDELRARLGISTP